MNELELFLSEMGLSINARFVPFSASRNKNNQNPSLNWKVTLFYKEKPVLKDIDYMAGYAHCPSYKSGKHKGYDLKLLVKEECETGFKSILMSSLSFVSHDKKKPILPSITDFVYSLLVDSEAIDYTFDDWCANFGYDTDSRSAYSTYEECVQIGIQLRSGIGAKNVELLRDAFQDY